ncbi:hypothetical protein Tco_0174083 [Tanacetum coccineum]
MNAASVNNGSLSNLYDYTRPQPNPGTSLSTTIAQDAPSTSASSSTSDIHHPVQHQEIAEEPTHEDTPINHDVLHPSHNLVTGDPGSAQSSSRNVNSAEPTQVNYPPDHLRRWTKDHPSETSCNPSLPRPVYGYVIALSSGSQMKLYDYGDVLKNIALFYLQKGLTSGECIDIENRLLQLARIEAIRIFIAMRNQNIDHLPDGWSKRLLNGDLQEELVSQLARNLKTRKILLTSIV